MNSKEESETEELPCPETWQIRFASNEKEQSQSLALMIQEEDADVKRQEVEKILSLHQSGKFDLKYLLIAEKNNEIRASILMFIQKDQTAVLWAPACDDEMIQSSQWEMIQDLLLQKATSIAKENSCDVIQATFHCDYTKTSQLFSRNGIPLQGTVLFMQKPALVCDKNEATSEVAPPSEKTPEILFEKQSEIESNSPIESSVKLVPVAQGVSDKLLGNLIQKTYQNSADFPGIVRHRTGGRALQTHRLQGEYDPANWFVIEENEIQVGVLFFALHSELNQWELTYLGIIPEHRGKGIARRAILAYLGNSQRKDLGVFLAVDAENHYAVSLYSSLGFVVVSRQLVHAWHQ